MSSRNLGTKPKVDRPARMPVETHVKEGSPEMEEKWEERMKGKWRRATALEELPLRETPQGSGRLPPEDWKLPSSGMMAAL